MNAGANYSTNSGVNNGRPNWIRMDLSVSGVRRPCQMLPSKCNLTRQENLEFDDHFLAAHFLCVWKSG